MNSLSHFPEQGQQTHPHIPGSNTLPDIDRLNQSFLVEQQPVASPEILESREKMLQSLLDPPMLGPTTPGVAFQHHPNYEYARDSGILDAFYYDPETGYDAIKHILIGDISNGEQGPVEVSGFHHEPSSRDPQTYVERSHLEGKSSKARGDYLRGRFEPYNARTIVGGFLKSILQTDDNGEVHLRPNHSSMFPADYDALTVLTAVFQAYESRDPSQDIPGYDNTWVAEGTAPMLDGKTAMKIRLIIDAESGKIITGFPNIAKTPKLKLSQQDVNHHLGLDN